MEGKKFSLTLLRREKGEKFSPLVEQTTSEQNAPHNYGLEKKILTKNGQKKNRVVS